MLLWAILLIAAGPTTAGEEDAPGAPPAPVRVLVAAGIESREPRTHLWIVEQLSDENFTVLHRMSDDEPGGLYHAFDGRGILTAAAARGRTLYCAFASGALQAIDFTPRPPPEKPEFPARFMPTLPKGTQLVALAAGSLGPAVLLEQQPTAPNALARPVLLRLRGLTWRETVLPEDFALDRFVALIAPDDARGSILLISRGAANAWVMHRLVGDQWSANRIALAARPDPQFVAVTQNGAANVLLVQRAAKGHDEELDVHLVRGETTAFLSLLPNVPRGTDWWAAVHHEGAQIVAARIDAPGAYRKARIVFPGGAASEWMTLRRGDRPTQVNAFSVLVIVMVVLGMVFMLLSGRRDGVAQMPRLPENTRIAGFYRIVAAGVDFAPGLMVAMIYFSVEDPLAMFMRLMEQPTELKQMIPPLVAIAIHVGHTTVTELFTGSTLGKVICGCRVVGLQGEPPHAGQVLARNFFKFLEMVFPLFLICPFILAYNQRLGDMVARTLVVSTTEPNEPDSEQEEDEKEEEEKFRRFDRDES